jgi:hypothetical protein
MDRIGYLLIALIAATLGAIGYVIFAPPEPYVPQRMTAFADLDPNLPLFMDGFDGYDCRDTITPDGTQRHRLHISNVAYTAQRYTRTGVRLDDYSATYSYNDATPGPILPWPGLTGSAPTWVAFRMDSYIGLRFVTPAVPAPGFATTLKVPTGIGSPRVTMAISRACGDFSHYLPSPGCLVVGPVPDSSVLYQHFGPGACELRPGTTYYQNMMYTDPIDRSRCTSNAPTCQLAVWR